MELLREKRLDIEKKISSILRENFSGEKTNIRIYNDRLNFACPYCGDSHENPYKKRGNLYLKSLSFHCFNCSKHTNVINFFKDHGTKVNNVEDLSYYLDYIQSNSVSVCTKEYLTPNTFNILNDYSIPIYEIKRKLKLQDSSENLKFKKYLESRYMHRRMRNFLFDPIKNQMYILHIIKDDNVISWQIRNFKYHLSKYVSYNIEKINHIILNRSVDLDSETISKINTLSLYFGIYDVDYSKPFTLFEGAIDSFLLPNSIALTGADKSPVMFDEISTVRYLFDNDLKGRKIMEAKLKRKINVFMWNMLLKDFKIHPRLANMKSVKDLNDLFKYAIKLNDKNIIKNIDRYFTNNPLDIRDV